MAKTESTPRGLQKTLLYTLFVAYLSQAAFSLLGLFQYHLDGANALAFYVNVAQLILVPVVLFWAAWIISPRKISKLGKAFESAVVAVIGFAAITFVGTLATVIPVGDLLYTYTISPFMPIVVTVVYVAILLALRATKRWK